MRNAETVLGIVRVRGQRGLPLEDVYRQLYNPDLYLRAYGRIYPNAGAMTPGATDETVDGMSRQKIEKLIDALRHERYRWTPVRRTHIPKKNGKTRPLGIPTWSDKLLQEVIRSLLEAYYEPQFSDSSHGFRPGRGCHTALNDVYRVWGGTKWFVEGDIAGCFDSIDHTVLLSVLRERIHDNRFLRLLESLLKAGYMQDWKYHATLSGTPQGGIVSPILANIYLDRLDKFVEQHILPTYTRGKRRTRNPEYRRLYTQLQQLQQAKQWEQAREVQHQLRQLPAGDTHDPKYRRVRYIRYADDFLLGFAGPKAEAEEIKEQVGTFLRDTLKLELSHEKTLISHATTQGARFLGYEIHNLHCNTKITVNRRSINGVVGLRMPAAFVREKCRRYMGKGKAIHRPELVNDADFSIVKTYQDEYRGFVQYYQLALNLREMGYLKLVMETSLLKTLACKHRSSVNKMVKKLRSTVETPHGRRTCLKVSVYRPDRKPLVAVFGGISLRREKTAVLNDQPPRHFAPHTEVVKRLLAERCEVCQETGAVEVHHVRKLADLKETDRARRPRWMLVMAARRRKTLVLCRRCHDDLHAGRPLRFREKVPEEAANTQ